jgi:SNF2 family DNA or RNA helicase
VLASFSFDHKILLTGTPLQNSIEELWALLHFLEPAQFPQYAQFKARFGTLTEHEDVVALQELLRPLMLRRLKEDVEKDIPILEETIIEVELTGVQKQYYKGILERNFSFLKQGMRIFSNYLGTSTRNMPNLNNAMMELRKTCIHPFLIKGAEHAILDQLKADTPEKELGAMVQASGKMVLIDKLLAKLHADGHRVLIFSQMVRCLNILEDYLNAKQYNYERIDGSVRGDVRQAAIDRFSKKDSDKFVMLLSTRAGGVGINLTVADTVIIFDSDWFALLNSLTFDKESSE